MAYNSVAANSGLVASAVANEVQTESQIKLQNFWELEKADVEEMKPKQVNAQVTESDSRPFHSPTQTSLQDVFKQQDLPLARIKKIMKLDEDLKNMMISAEAPVLFAKAAELFIREITLRAWIHTERNKRRTLQRNDIAMAVADPDTDMFDFLIDIVPREEVKPSQPRREEAVTPGTGGTQGAVPAVSQVQQLQQPVQYVFQIPGQQCPQSIQILMPQQFQQANATAMTNGNGAGSDVAQMVSGAAGGMQVVQLMPPQQQGAAVGHVDGGSAQAGATTVVRQATSAISGQQPMVVNAMAPQAIQIQNLGGQAQSVILQQPAAAAVVAGAAAGSSTPAGASSTADSGQGDVTSLSVGGGTAEVVVKTDPLEDESSPTQDG